VVRLTRRVFFFGGGWLGAGNGEGGRARATAAICLQSWVAPRMSRSWRSCSSRPARTRGRSRCDPRWAAPGAGDTGEGSRGGRGRHRCPLSSPSQVFEAARHRGEALPSLRSLPTPRDDGRTQPRAAGQRVLLNIWLYSPNSFLPPDSSPGRRREGKESRANPPGSQPPPPPSPSLFFSTFPGGGDPAPGRRQHRDVAGAGETKPTHYRGASAGRRRRGRGRGERRSLKTPRTGRGRRGYLLLSFPFVRSFCFSVSYLSSAAKWLGGEGGRFRGWG